MTPTAKLDDTSKRELIAFRMGEQEFCVDVMSIREIRGWTTATPLPASPAYVHGVINLRGTVLPIIDLAARFGFPPAEPTARHAIIVTQSGAQLVGLLVEGVSEIFTIDERQIQPTPEVASEIALQFVQGIIAVDERLISVVAIDSVVPATEALAA